MEERSYAEIRLTSQNDDRYGRTDSRLRCGRTPVFSGSAAVKQPTVGGRRACDEGAAAHLGGREGAGTT
jgi:hypothetical protein